MRRSGIVRPLELNRHLNSVFTLAEEFCNNPGQPIEDGGVLILFVGV